MCRKPASQARQHGSRRRESKRGIPSAYCGMSKHKATRSRLTPTSNTRHRLSIQTISLTLPDATWTPLDRRPTPQKTCESLARVAQLRDWERPNGSRKTQERGWAAGLSRRYRHEHNQTQSPSHRLLNHSAVKESRNQTRPRRKLRRCTLRRAVWHQTVAFSAKRRLRHHRLDTLYIFRDKALMPPVHLLLSLPTYPVCRK